MNETNDLYLIAHKVRGEPSLDVAQRIDCPTCNSDGSALNEDGEFYTGGCHECDTRGYWWIIPTSGHRAYPYAWEDLYAPASFHDMPTDWPDHYIQNEPRKISLAESLGITKPTPPALPPIVRRM